MAELQEEKKKIVTCSITLQFFSDKIKQVLIYESLKISFGKRDQIRENSFDRM